MNWCLKSLSELSEVITKGTTPTSLGFSYTTSGIRFLRAQNINYGRVNFFDDDLYIDSATHKALGRSQILNGDLLVSIAGSIGRSGIVISNNEPLNCNQAVAIVRLKKGVNERYISHALDSQAVKDQITNSTVTGVISNLSLSQLGNLKIPIPSLSEQQRIAELLDAANHILKLRKLAISKAKQLINARFQLELNEEKFKEQRIGDLCSLITKGTTPTSLGYSFSDSGVLFLRAQNVIDGKVERSREDLYISASTHDALKRSKIYAGDVLLTIAGTIGRSAVVKHQLGKVNCNQAVAILRCSEQIDAHYLSAWLESSLAKDQISKSTVTGVISNLSLSQIANLKINLPSKEMQLKFKSDILKIYEKQELFKKSYLSTLKLISSLKHQSFAVN
jgi:type I restriction enzyme S subunit